jgi:hypothetical protein
MFRRTRAVFPLLLLALLAPTGCFTAGVSSPAARDGNHKSDTGVVWFWGISDAVKNAEECTGGLAEVKTQFPWYTYIVTPLTLGIIHPVNRQYYCAAGS